MKKQINVLIYQNAVSALLSNAKFCHVHIYYAFHPIIYDKIFEEKSFVVHTQGSVNSYVTKENFSGYQEFFSFQSYTKVIIIGIDLLLMC